MGDNAILLNEESKEDMGKIIRENNEWLTTMFKSSIV